LLIILISYAVMSSKTPFPGAAALAPVIGTALLIRYGQSGWVSRLLSYRPVVQTGKISYSLYLWHWPVIVFWKYALFDQLCGYDYVGMFLLALLLGYLSWRFIEIPVRTSPAWTMRRSFIFAATGIAFLVSLGTACVYCRGWPTILHPRANEFVGMPPRGYPFVQATILRIINRFVPPSAAEGGPGTFTIGDSGEPEIFLLGDSHALALRYGLDSLLRESHRAGYYINCNASDMFDMRSKESQTALKTLAALPRVSRVILAERWANGHPSRLHGETRDARLEEFARYIRSMGKTLLLVMDVPSYPYVCSDIAARTRIISPRQMRPILDSYQQSNAEYDRVQGKINCELEEISKKSGAVLIPLYLAFKQDDHYVSMEERGGRTVFLYSDTDHLSAAGSLRAARFIMPYLLPVNTTKR
jgi:hypothetical protein